MGVEVRWKGDGESKRGGEENWRERDWRGRN